MIVDPCLIAGLLAPSHQTHRNLDIVYRDSGVNAATVSVREAMRLADRGLIRAKTSKDGRVIRYLIAAVSVHAIRRTLNEMRRPQLPAGAISKPIKHAGDAHWPIRYDRAKGGRMGDYTRLYLHGPATL